MISSDEKYRDIVKGEVAIICDELKKYHQPNYSDSLDETSLEKFKPHLISIEQKIGRNSIEYINITTEIVDALSKKILNLINIDSSVIDKLSPSATVKFYANQRDNLIIALNICRKLDNMNMDYAYRIRTFNKTKEKVENTCREKGIEIRTLSQKNIDKLKAVGTITGVVAKETAGCAIVMAIKIAMILLIFLILMTIFGVK